MASLEHLASIMAQKLTEHFRELMDTVAGARISAGDLRRMGFDIEDSVPDRATIETAALTVQHGQHEAETQTLNMRLTLDLDRFEWFDMHEVARRTLFARAADR